MSRGIPGGKQAAVGSPVGLPAAAFLMLRSKVLAYSGVSGGFWPRPGGIPGVQPIPPWLIQMPVRSRRLVGRYSCLSQLGSVG